MERIETTILRNLVHDEEYARKTIPFIQPDFFEDKSEKIIFIGNDGRSRNRNCTSL